MEPMFTTCAYMEPMYTPCVYTEPMYTTWFIRNPCSPPVFASGSLQVKLAMLNYLTVLVPCMEPSDFSNNSDTRLIVSRIISWTNEPKKPEVRKVRRSSATRALSFETNLVTIILKCCWTNLLNLIEQICLPCGQGIMLLLYI